MKKSIISTFICLIITTSCIKDVPVVKPGSSVNNPDNDNGGFEVPTGPVDPLLVHSWHLSNTGQTAFSSSRGKSGEDINVLPVYALGVTGSGVKIAVSDSGIDLENEDLVGNQIKGQHRNYAMTNPDLWRTSLPYFVGDDAHGTATTGIVAATGWNGLGSRGVAPRAKYGAFRFIGNFTGTASTDLARNIDQMDGDFDIFNYSYGYGQCYFNTEDDLALEGLEDGVKNLRGGKGSIYVQSSGNEYIGTIGACIGSSSTVRFAGNTNSSDDMTVPQKVIVGAINAHGVKASYSTPGSSIWVSAPGGGEDGTGPRIITTDISGCAHGYSISTYDRSTFNNGSKDNHKCDYTNIMNGTSAAAPVVSGVVALMLHSNSSLTWRDVKHILAMTSDQVDYLTDGQGNHISEALTHPLGTTYELPGYVYDVKWTQNRAGIDYSNWYGFGRVNALAAVLMASSYTFPLGAYESTVNPHTKKWYYDSGTINVPIPNDDSFGTPDDNSTIIDVNHNFFIESVEIQLNVNHPAADELAVLLISPMGTTSRLLNINSNMYTTELPEDMRLLSNAFYGEQSLGQWRIKIIDGSSNNTVEGALTHWKIKINGHRFPSDGSNPLPVTDLTITSPYPAGGTNSTTPPVTFTPSPSSDLIRYEMSVGTAPGRSDVTPWLSINMDINPAQLSGITLGPGRVYYLNIRAVDSMENYSEVATQVWNSI